MTKTSETSANRMLSDTARMRISDAIRVASIETTARMPVLDRRARMREAEIMRHNVEGLPAPLMIQAE
jgi:hypothetical protein